MTLQYDPAEAIATLRDADPSMGQLIERVGPFKLEPIPMPSPFQALMRSIMYQQLSTKAARTIHGRVLALFPGQQHPRPQQILETPDEALRGAGVSRAKLAAIKDLAAKTLDGTVPSTEALRTMDDEAVVARLTAVRGIGRWTAEMLLIFYLARPDVLPATDLGVQKGFMLTYGLAELPRPKDLAAHGARWQPYRSVASWYLWRALDLQG